MPSYKDTILATPGLVHYFRMSGGATDTDLGPGGATLTHNGGPAEAQGLIKDANGAKAALDSGLGLSDVHRGDLDPHSFDANGLEEL